MCNSARTAPPWLRRAQLASVLAVLFAASAPLAVAAQEPDEPPPAEQPAQPEPDAGAPDAQAPDAQTPDAQTPDAQAPGAQAPGAQAPGAQAPGAQAPGAQAPGAQAPGAQAPGAQAPGAQAPDAQAPGAPAPGAQPPGAQAPGAPAPGVPVPGAPAPGAAAPPAAGPAIDPTTGEPYTEPQSMIDPATGMLVDAVTQLPLPRPPVVDPVTGQVRPDAPRLDPATGQLVDPATNRPVPGAPAIDAATGALIDPATGLPETDPATGLPAPDAQVVDPATGQLRPMSRIIDPASGALIDPATRQPIPASPVYDPATMTAIGGGEIIDPVTRLPVPLPGEEEEVENPYGLEALWREGGVVARGTLLVLLLMFSAIWYIIFTKFIEQAILMRQARRLRSFWEAETVAAGIESLPPRGPFHAIAEYADPEFRREPYGLASKIDPRKHTAIGLQRTLDGLSARLQNGMAVLATVGATAPFVGLFGTVVGIYRALIEIGVSGEPSIDRVAGPVGEALIMTALGLFVAVPAVFLYNVLGRRNKVINDNARAFAADVDALIESSPEPSAGPEMERERGDYRTLARR